ncbi:hypothetical protein [Pseudorhodoplanes sinuspersici]|uniref:hypothetical protein n=1 Tax=Pseudorhodoplanes sinuspersici TaxID=1235591 RepID=UPI0011C445E7|nr:hypothetical protein [Pseudorhodoplanes sinuspersici]
MDLLFMALTCGKAVLIWPRYFRYRKTWRPTMSALRAAGSMRGNGIKSEKPDDTAATGGCVSAKELPLVVRYASVREGNQWKLDDIRECTFGQSAPIRRRRHNKTTNVLSPPPSASIQFETKTNFTFHRRGMLYGYLAAVMGMQPL